ncbi:MAG: TIGR03936 family radical SAM-associated protein, partial [Anaerolineae bacterium]
MVKRGQRIRITFSKGEEIQYISHLDMMRLWKRTLRRANLPLAYSKGFNPQPKISIAAPLPVGF